jgi:hypothetical protein
VICVYQLQQWRTWLQDFALLTLAVKFLLLCGHDGAAVCFALRRQHEVNKGNMI